MRSSNTGPASRRALWVAAGVAAWGVSTLGVVALYDRFLRLEPAPTQVVKHIHERPVIRVESSGAEANQRVRPESQPEAQPAPGVREEEAELDDRNVDPEQREIERRERFDRIVREFEAQPHSGAERSRQTVLQGAIDQGLEGLPATASVRRGDVECRGGGCSMPVFFAPDTDFRSFDAAVKQATSSDVVRDESSGRKPLRSLHTYKDGDQVVGRYFFRWKEQ